MHSHTDKYGFPHGLLQVYARFGYFDHEEIRELERRRKLWNAQVQWDHMTETERQGRPRPK